MTQQPGNDDDELAMMLRRTFLEEAEQMLLEAERLYLELSGGRCDAALLDHIFRIAHNFKGSSGAVGYVGLSGFMHQVESLILQVKSGKRAATCDVVEMLLACNDHLGRTLAGLKGDPSRESMGPGPEKELAALLAGEGEAKDLGRFGFFDEPAPPAPPPVQAQAAAAAVKPRTDETIRVHLSRIDELLNTVGEIVIAQTVLSQHRDQIESPLLQRTVAQLQKTTKELQSLAMSLRMVPLTTTFQKMQRIVRDTSRSLGKEIDLTLEGETTEVDKTVVELIGDPLVHLVRNAVDHGIECGDERVAAGKKAAGKLKLTAAQRAGKIVIEVEDDGKGLDPKRLVAKAIERGILPPDAALTAAEAHQLIFKPGFSTKAEITDVSGRGVGLDVVKTNIQALQGDIAIDTNVGRGTRFTISLPLTLAIAEGMVVHIGEERYVVPISNVLETYSPTDADVTKVSEQEQILTLREASLPLFPLAELLGRRRGKKRPSNAIALIVPDGRKHDVAVLVDEVSRKQQVVIKRLGDEIHGLRGISGSAILGDGRAALILDLAELIGSHRDRSTKSGINELAIREAR